MNSPSQTNDEKLQSKRHRSVITPTMENIQIFNQNDIISNKQNENKLKKKIKLRSNSLFAYQEYDKYTSLFGINNIQYTSSSNNSSYIENSEIEDEFSDNYQNQKNNYNIKNLVINLKNSFLNQTYLEQYYKNMYFYLYFH